MSHTPHAQTAQAPSLDATRHCRLSRALTSPLTFMCFILALSVLVEIHLGVAQPRFSDPRIQQALKDLEAEPSIQEVHRAALRFYNAEPETISSLRTRANLKYLLPDVNVRYRQSNNGVFIDKFDYLQGDPNRAFAIGKDSSDGDVSEVQLSGTWSLSRLLFNPEVLDVSSLAALQEGVLKEVTRLYYTRRRLQIDLILNPPRDPSTQLSKEIRLQQVTANLNALTNNIFQRHEAGHNRVTRGGEW